MVDRDKPSLPPDDARPGGVRNRKKDEVRTRILDAWIELMVEGAADLNHDSVAARAGVGRRTVYRYFPDREALMEATVVRVRELAGPLVVMPKTMDELLATLEPIHTGFDKIAPVVTAVRSTPQGRALRLAEKATRVRSYTKAAADAVKDLPARDQILATAMFQMLHTTAWLEMRDNWGLTGKKSRVRPVGSSRRCSTIWIVAARRRSPPARRPGPSVSPRPALSLPARPEPSPAAAR